MNPDYRSYYRALDVAPGCTWTQLRAAYRRLVRTWHPDRFDQDPERRILAEEKTKEINRAYQVLSDYQERHGRLPDVISRPEPHPANAPHYPQRPQAPVGMVAEPEWATDTRTIRRGRSTRLLPLALMGFAAWMTYTLWQPAATIPTWHEPHPAKVAVPIGPVADHGADEAADDEGVFTVGSSPNQVQAAEGLPERIRGDVWYYGKSRIYFTDGMVQRWVNDPSHPLHVAFGEPRQHRLQTTFTIGATRSEVLAVQGPPLLETDQTWDYGVSRVYFSGGHVSGWYSSPFAPLKVKR